jgi:transcription elongation factor GreA
MNSLHEPIWLTRAAYDQRQAELDDRIRDAGADAETDPRIHQLRALLRRAEVGDKPDDGLVEPGMLVTVLFDGEAASTSFLLADREFAGDDPGITVDVYPPTSPLGAAINGGYPGHDFAYEAPTGTRIRGRIVSAVPFRTPDVSE